MASVIEIRARELVEHMSRGAAAEIIKGLQDSLANAVRDADAAGDLNERYRAAAKVRWEREGEIEIDDSAVVSIGDDGGAYIHAWVWVRDSDHGITRTG